MSDKPKVTEEDEKVIEELKEIFLEGLREGARKHEEWRKGQKDSQNAHFN